MAAPQSRQDLTEYALRSLGAPVLEINVDDDQISDRLDEALQYYQEYHSDGVVKTYYKHQVTSTDITNEYINLPEQLLFVKRIMPFADENSSVNMFDARYQMHLNDIFDLRNAGSVDNYVQTQQYISTLDMIFNGSEQIRFNRHMNRLFVDTEWGADIKEGDYIIVEGYQTVDPNDFPDVLNDMWLKRYFIALLKRQWGQNLIKFEGMQLPGGVTINGRQMYEDGIAEIQALEEEIRLNHEMPADFFMG